MLLGYDGKAALDKVEIAMDEASSELPDEAVRALEAHKKQLDADIQAGRFQPGERRCVTLPTGERFYLSHPEPAPELAVGWWRRLLGRR